MKLISELHEDVQVLTEEKDGKKKVFIEGVFLQSGVKNRNGRIYPPAVLEREVGRYTSDLIKNNRAMGELGHPNGPSLNLDRVSHIVKECRRSGNDYVGKAQLLDTPMGTIAQQLIQAEARLGVSSRGMGSLKEDKDGTKIVQDDFHLAVMIDIVADPSAPSAWVNGVMEGVEWVLNEKGEWSQIQIEKIRKEIHETPAGLLPEKKLQVFESYIEGLMETQMVDALVKWGGVERPQAKNAVRRAKIKATMSGHGGDSRFVFQHARGILGIGGR